MVYIVENHEESVRFSRLLLMVDIPRGSVIHFDHCK